MYAHQVIEALKERAIISSNKKLRDDIQRMVADIEPAHKFHIPNIGLFDNIAQKSKGQPLFGERQSDELMLPYTTHCWIDFVGLDKSGQTYKRGILVHQHISNSANVIFVRIFAFIREVNVWLPSPAAYFVSIGQSILDANILSKNDLLRINCASAAARANILQVCMPWSGIKKQDTIRKRALRDEQQTDLSILEYFILFLSCKNITTEKHPTPEALNRKRKKQGKKPLFTYHTLILKPFGKTQESIPRHLWNNRIHLQRGHFKTYTEDKPLFGKITGRFWWQPHVRGQNKDGIVLKDYQLGDDK